MLCLWDGKILKQSCKVVDIGCGDADIVQNLIDYIENYWTKKSINDKKIHIHGVDLNYSRIDNANKLVSSKKSKYYF